MRAVKEPESRVPEVCSEALHARAYMPGQPTQHDVGFAPLASSDNASVFGTAERGKGTGRFACPALRLRDGHEPPASKSQSLPGRPAFSSGRAAAAGGDRHRAPRDYHFASENGVSGRSLREHHRRPERLQLELEKRRGKNAIIHLTPMKYQGHATILRAFHHYLSLDSQFQAHNHGLGARLKTDSTLYRCLMAEYRKWLVG